MRVGIVGAGVMGGVHAAGWLATPAQVAGFRDTIEGRAQERAARFGGQVYDSLAALVRDVDVVDVCTPTDVHYEIVMAAIAAGKHVVCEKPLARSVEQGREMIAASRAAGVKLLVGQVVRFFPEYAAAKAAVDRGVIGKPAVLRLARCVSQPRKATDNWFVDFKRSGGVVLDLMVHDFDYARWVAGEVTTVYAKTLGVARPEAGVDHALAILTHASGAITHVEGSWAFPAGFYTAFELAGSEGLLAFDSDASSPVRFLRHRRPEEAVPEVPLPANPLLESQYTTEIKAFYATLAHDAALRVSAADGLAAVQIALAVIESAQTGRAIRIEPPIGDQRSGEALA
jgi:predicted dehydrogenase